MHTFVRSPDAAFEHLAAARASYSQAEIAKALGVTPRTVRRWESRDTQPPHFVIHALQQLVASRLLPFGESAFSFIDLFAGIGGIRIAFEEIGGRCVFTSEWDEYARKTYQHNFGATEQIQGDITAIHAEDMPKHDVLLAGFPCQPFSIAGVSKKNALGRLHGFQDVTQGTLFFDVARIIDHHRPRAFLLENVKNLKSHDGGRTFDIIMRTLRDELGYDVHARVIDGAHFVPQHRERIIIAGFREPVAFDWEIMDLPNKGSHSLSEILHRTDGKEPELEWDEGRFFDHAGRRVNPKYTLTDHLWGYLQDYKAKHQAKGNGFGYGLFSGKDVARTLSARYYKDGSEILIRQRGRTPRRLTPRECARLMGFPDTFRIPVSDTRAYKQFGNSVVVPVIREVARLVKPFVTGSPMNQPELALMGD